MAKPLAQRANAAADTYVFRSPAPSSSVASLPSPPRADSPPPAESRSHAPPPAPLIVDLPASYFPQPPPAELETQRRAPGVARPLVPGAEPPPFKPPPTFFQGSGRSAAPAPPIMMTPLEIQRLANARAAAARQQQHMAQQHSARAPLPTGTLLVGAPAAPPAHAVEDARRIREAAAWAAHAQQEAQQRPGGGEGGPALAKRLDDMFSVIKTLPRGVSAEAEDWAAVAVAERAAAMRSSTVGAGSGFSAGAAEAIAAAAAAREAAARDAGGAALRGAAAAAEAERARQRLAALRSSHPDAFPVMNPKALYTPWSDDSAASATGRSGASGLGFLDDDDDGEVETHLVARLLGARWRVRMAAALAVLTFGVYVRGEWAGWGVEGTAGGLLTWHAGDAAAVEGNHTHTQLSLVVRAADADASSAGGSAPPLPPGAQPAEGLQAQAAAAVDAAKADDVAAVAAKAAEEAAVALAEATATHAGEARRLLARTRQR